MHSNVHYISAAQTEQELKQVNTEKDRMEREKNDRIKELEIKINSMGLAYENVLNVSHHYFSISMRQFFISWFSLKLFRSLIKDGTGSFIIFSKICLLRSLFWTATCLVRELCEVNLLCNSLDLMFILPLLCKVACLLWPFSREKLVALQNRQTVVDPWESALWTFLITY